MSNNDVEQTAPKSTWPDRDRGIAAEDVTPQAVANFYDSAIARQVAAGITIRHKAILRAMKELGCLQRGMNILEIGCGIGTVTELIARAGVQSIHATDISEASISVARQRLARFPNVTFEVSSAPCLPREAFDLIILPDVLEHIPVKEHPRLFSTLYDSLRVGGYVFIHIPDPDHLDYTRKHHPEQLQIIDQSIRCAELTRAIGETGFDIVHLERYALSFRPYDYRRILLYKGGIQPLYRRKHPYWFRKLRGGIKRAARLFKV